MEEKKEAQEKKIEQTKQDVKKDIKASKQSLKTFFGELLDIRHDTDKDKTIQSIKDNIAMKGHTAWILVFSILIASIGLNISSTAVVIGAMLISPLMGPILGIGLSIGINDIDTLRRSIANLGIMLAISLLTSFVFFYIPLFQEATPELLARTQPDVRDVLIAIAGGLALVVAITRPSTQTNTVAGVAIATALMPPLCTAGYGLAIGQWNYFFGAMFLFLINTIFIALATFVIVKYLNFPMVKYINSSKRKFISRLASFVAIIVLGLSVFTFYKLYKKNTFKDNAARYISALKEKGIIIIDEEESDINFRENNIEITVFGRVTSKDIKDWNTLKNEFGLTDVKLHILGGKDDSKMISEVQNLREEFAKNQKLIEGRDASLRTKEDRIRFLEKEMRKLFRNRIPFLKISEEAQINYEGLKEISYSDVIKTNFKKVDTITAFSVKWFDSIPEETITLQEKKLYQWLKTRLELDTIRLTRN